MSLWKELSTEQLYKILECENIAKIYKRLKQLAEDGIAYDLERTINKIRKKYNNDLSKQQIMPTVFSILSNETSYPLIVLLTIAQAVTLGFLTLGILTIGTAIVSLAAGIFYFYTAYRENKIESQQNQDSLDFTHIKLECAKEIIRRDHELNNQHDNNATFAQITFAKPFVFKNENRLRLIKSAITTTFLTASSLFAIYYLTAAVILAAFSITTALFGPIGIGVAIGATLLIGLYAGYKQYQSLYNNEKLDAYKAHQAQQLEKKCDQCDALRGIIKHKKLHSTQSDYSHSARHKYHKLAFFESTTALQRRNFIQNEPHSPPLSDAAACRIRPN